MALLPPVTQQIPGPEDLAYEAVFKQLQPILRGETDNAVILGVTETIYRRIEILGSFEGLRCVGFCSNKRSELKSIQESIFRPIPPPWL